MWPFSKSRHTGTDLSLVLDSDDLVFISEVSIIIKLHDVSITGMTILGEVYAQYVLHFA